MARRVDQESASEISHGEALVDLAAGDVLPILLVDDRPDNLRTLEAVLAPLGHPLVTASSGSQALRLLLERDFALILLDVRMPGMGGLETAELIKSRARSSDMPIVFLTAAREEVQDIIRGYSVGAVDYVLKPFDPDLLRSKVAVFTELESSRRALKRSEALLRGAFEAAPIGKTLLDSRQVIVRSNPAFARLVGSSTEDLLGVAVAELCHPDDLATLSATLERVTQGAGDTPEHERTGADLRLQSSSGAEVWVGIVASLIEPTELAQPPLLVQWVDLTARRRAERVRGELMMEQAARHHAESTAERLSKLQALTRALESLSLEELMPELAIRLAITLGADAAEVQATDPAGDEVVFHASDGSVRQIELGEARAAADRWEEAPVRVEGVQLGSVRVAPGTGRPFGESERSLLYDAAERAALSIRRAQLHQQEHQIAVELQRGLIPNRLPPVRGLELAAHYEAAGPGAEVGGDWYDAFALPGGRLGVVLGDVAGSGIRAASTMGQLRSVTRAYALGDDGSREPGEVLTRLNRYRLALDEPELFTALYAIIDPGNGSIAWANAGHPPPLLLSSSATSFLEGGDALMGVEDGVYQTRHESIARLDTLLLYTDGLIERRGESLDVGLERLARAAASGPEDPAELCAHVLRELAPAGDQRQDDVTAVVVKVR